jgi:hypothetical protein
MRYNFYKRLLYAIFKDLLTIFHLLTFKIFTTYWRGGCNKQ